MSIANLRALVGLSAPFLFKYSRRSPWKYTAWKSHFKVIVLLEKFQTYCQKEEKRMQVEKMDRTIREKTVYRSVVKYNYANCKELISKTFGKYSVTIIIGLLCVTAPRNCTTLGCLIFWSNASSSLNAFLQKL